MKLDDPLHATRSLRGRLKRGRGGGKGKKAKVPLPFPLCPFLSMPATQAMPQDAEERSSNDKKIMDFSQRLTNKANKKYIIY